MSIDSLSNKYFILKRNNKCYCSKCGKIILNDTYQFSKHQNECKVNFVDKFKAYEEKDIYGYAFRILNGKLVFFVYQPKLELVPGFSDKYNGAKWTVKFKATFDLDSKHIVEEGLYNVDVWFKMLLEKADSVCLNKVAPEKIIRKCFKSIPYLYSFGDFLDIYRQRGYHYNNIDIEKIKEIKDDKKIKHALFGDKANIVDVYEHQIDKDVVLEMNIYDYRKNRIGRAFVSKDFYYSEDDFDYNEFFALKGEVKRTKYTETLEKKCPHYVINNIDKFKSTYPDLMIDNYLDGGGTNLFQAILSSNYNKMIENLSKSGLGIIADNVEFLTGINIYGNNIKQIFGFNINIIKQFNNVENFNFLKDESIYSVISEVLEIQPAIFNLKLTSSALYILCNNFKKTGVKTRFDEHNFTIKGIHNLDSKELLKLMKAFSEDNMDIYYYRDYMEMCKELQAYPYGKIPKDIITAHEYVAEIYECSKDRILSENFKKAVNREEYLLLDSTAYKDKNGEIHHRKDEEEFRIITPQTQYDLTHESECLKHCVKTYIKTVANKHTFILFLRKKNDLKTPLATIEVNNQNVLIQLKAFCNQRASKEAQEFVKKWAKEKNIRIESYDINY